MGQQQSPNRSYTSDTSKYSHGQFGFNNPGMPQSAHDFNQLPTKPVAIDEEEDIDYQFIEGDIEKQKVVDMINDLLENEESPPVIMTLAKLRLEVILG